MNRLFRFRALALAVCSAVLGASAQAAPLELFDQPNFGGTVLGLSNAIGNLSTYGFNDKASSLIVRSGTWEICTDADFRGVCRTFAPGEYRSLPAGFSESISSARMAGSSNTPPPPAGRALIVLYKDAGFAGQRVEIDGPVADLNSMGFNDEMSSFEIISGNWQMCDNAHYQERCDIVGPGRYDIWNKANDRLSSLRPVGAGVSTGAAPYPPSYPPTYGSGFGTAVLYLDSGFAGPSVRLTNAVQDLNSMDFNDAASSIEVMGVPWEFCTDASYGGRCFVLAPGRHEIAHIANDALSSARPAANRPQTNIIR